MLKPSEALMLGSTLLRPKAYTLNDGNGNGCALGMIAEARGFRRDRSGAYPLEAGRGVPWGDDYPCTCVGPISSPLVHIFNEHVCGDRTWTIEMLADWLRRFESDEESAPEAAAPRRGLTAIAVAVGEGE